MICFLCSRVSAGRWPLEMPLFRFAAKDYWRLRDSLEGLAIFGAQGSGKTSSSGRLIAHKFLRAGFGGLVCCAKADEADLWRRYLGETGREADGRFFSVDGDLRFNFVDYESKTSSLGFVENLVTLMCDVASIRRSAEGGGNQAFWIAERAKLVRNGLTLLLLAEQSIEIRSLYAAIASSPRSAAQLQSEEWRKKSYLYQLLCAAQARHGVDHDELNMVGNYFLTERLEIHGGTAGTVLAEFTGTFDALRRGKIGELLGTTTNISPADILDGRVVVVDIPTDYWRQVGQLAQVAWIQSLMRAVDRRPYDPPHTRPVFLWQDEAHQFSIDQDAAFQSGARSKGIATVRISQNLPGYLDSYGRDGKHKVDQLLGNHGTKFFHRNDDPVTNEWASKLIASDITYKASLSSSAPAALNTSLSEHEQASCSPRMFLGLKNGGSSNKFVAEAIVCQSGRLFKGDRWLIGEFRQRSKMI